MKDPIYAFHSNRDGKIMAAGAFDYGYKLNDWLKGLDIEGGDKIVFEPLHVRGEDNPPTAPIPVPVLEGAE